VLDPIGAAAWDIGRDRGATPVTDARTTVVVADDHEPMRALTTQLLVDGGFEVVGEAGDAAGAVGLARRRRPAVCLLDINMPGDGIEAARTIASELPDTCVVMLTVLADDDHLFRALRAGARGYVVKGTAPAAMVEALQGVLVGEPALSPGIAMRILDQFGTSAGASRRVHVPDRGYVQLSPREADVLDLLRQGLSTSAIARRLFISPVTVRSHIAAVLKKLNATDRAEAVRLFEA
jgi:DNA-binding NarL/FixJ family response regulator